MQTSSQSPRPLSPFHNPYAMTLGQGAPIDWAKVSAYFFQVGKFTVKLSALSAIGDTSLDVDALAYPIKKGTNLDFGTQASVLVTVNDADVNAAETAITVVALPGPLPAGAVLPFSGSGAGFARLSAAAAAGATSITVDALPEDIDNAATATYQGGPLNAEVTADVAAGAVAITVAPLPFALANDAEAIADYTGSADKRKIPLGTVMCKTSAGLLLPRRDAPGAEEAVGFLVSDADEVSVVDAKSGYGIVIGNTAIWENLCPDAVAGDLPAAYKTELGTNSLGFTYEDWEDDRVV